MVRKRLSCALCLLGAAAGLWGVARFCRASTDGFTFLKVAAALPSDHAAVSQELKEILQQTFTYLTRGKQCFVFASADGRTVLKLIQKTSRIEEERVSYRLAFEELKEETGLIAVHLEKTEPLFATLVDKLNIQHRIDLGELEFIIQKRAELVFPTLATLRDRGDHTAAQRAVERLYQLVETRRAKGIADRDPNVSKNFGFVDGVPIQIDVGRFSRGQSEGGFKNEGLKHWIHKYYPELEEALP